MAVEEGATRADAVTAGAGAAGERGRAGAADDARYRMLFESIDEGFCVIEVLFDARGDAVDYRFIEANPAFVAQTGLADVVGRTMRELAPAHEGHWFETYGRVARTGEPARFEAPAEALGRWYDVYAFRVGEPEDRRVAVLFDDVTAAKAAARERERLVAALELERSRLSAVFAQTPSVMAIVRGPQHVLEMANDAYLALNGRRDVIGKPLLDAVPELRGQGFDRLLDAVVATGEPFVGREVPIWLSTSPGAPPEERFFDFVYLPLVEPDASGAPVRVGVIAHGNDITEQVRARREVERARERADRLQELTAALAAAGTPEEVAEVVVAQGVSATGAATGMLALRVADAPDGRPPEAVLLRERGLGALVIAEHARFPLAAAGPAAACLRTGEAFFLETPAAVLARFPELAAVWEELGTHALATVPLAVAGETVGAMSFTFTAPREFPAEVRGFFLAVGRQAAQALERARLFGAERAARADAEAANRAKSEFLAIMSHELRTPLNAIGGYAELMEMGIRGPISEQQREDLGRIQSSQRHLLGLINEVLNYAKLETGAVRFTLEDVPVRDALAEAEGLVAPQARAKGIALRVAACDGGLLVRADAEKLRQVLVNLLSNAVKFTDRGGRIELSCAAGDSRVRIHVRDTGIGIVPDKIEAVFEPFVQVRADLTRTAEGTGLGLAISRDLARGMGGDLVAESTPGAGSTFTVVLPGA